MGAAVVGNACLLISLSDVDKRLRSVEQSIKPILIYDRAADITRQATQSDIDDMQNRIADMQNRLRELGEIKDKLREIAAIVKMDWTT